MKSVVYSEKIFNTASDKKIISSVEFSNDLQENKITKIDLTSKQQKRNQSKSIPFNRKTNSQEEQLKLSPPPPPPPRVKQQPECARGQTKSLIGSRRPKFKV